MSNWCLIMQNKGSIKCILLILEYSFVQTYLELLKWKWHTCAVVGVTAERFVYSIWFFLCTRSADMRTCTFVIRWATRLACAVKEQEVVISNGTIRVPETGVNLYLGDIYFRWEQLGKKYPQRKPPPPSRRGLIHFLHVSARSGFTRPRGTSGPTATATSTTSSCRASPTSRWPSAWAPTSARSNSTRTTNGGLAPPATPSITSKVIQCLSAKSWRLDSAVAEVKG